MLQRNCSHCIQPYKLSQISKFTIGGVRANPLSREYAKARIAKRITAFIVYPVYKKFYMKCN